MNFRELSDEAFYIALDENGKQKDTREWSIFSKMENASRKEVVFIIGGAHGLSEAIPAEQENALLYQSLLFLMSGEINFFRAGLSSLYGDAWSAVSSFLGGKHLIF